MVYVFWDHLYYNCIHVINTFIMWADDELKKIAFTL